MQRLQSRRWIRLGGGITFTLLVAIQIVPYGHVIAEPDRSTEIHWNSSRTEELARRACYDCHSNAPQRPWYARIAPVSWVIQREVEQGREHLNFSEWNLAQPNIFEAANKVVAGEMPPYSYRLFHPEARLTIEEEEELIEGIYATIGIRRVVQYSELVGNGSSEPPAE